MYHMICGDSGHSCTSLVVLPEWSDQWTQYFSVRHILVSYLPPASWCITIQYNTTLLSLCREICVTAVPAVVKCCYNHFHWVDHSCVSKGLPYHLSEWIVVDHFCIALFFTLEQTHCTHVICYSEVLWLSIPLVYVQWYLVVALLVPCDAAAVSAHVLCAPYKYAPVYSVTSCKVTY